MKKIQALLLSGLMASMLLAGCGSTEAPADNGSSSDSGITVEVETIPVQDAEETVAETVTEETAGELYDDEYPGEGYVRSYLTNEWVTEDVYNQRPLTVMMPTDAAAQPQYNIGNAGVLYECMEEGSISRQLAVIDDWHEMEKIGNVRSCRLYYIYMASEWDPILVHFGGVYYMQDLITRPEINNISGTNEYGTGGEAPGSGAFFRSSDKSAPHNAYTSGEKLLKACDSLGYSLTHRDQYFEPDHFTFTSGSNPNTLEGAKGVDTATKIDLSDVFPVTRSYLEYDEETKTYKKYLHDSKQIDAVTGDQLTFTNVIVQYTDYYVLDEKGYLDMHMVDSKKDGYYFTQGKVIPITWTKTDLYSPTKYYDMDGNELVLNTGKTYIAIAQSDTNVIYE
ncbi:MAG: DUF3048 domain-containing protein [Lachnospiraceae bacterium]|nr:DUF3048 domain-containing protein [Lachnospiraceae bacterium]